MALAGSVVLVGAHMRTQSQGGHAGMHLHAGRSEACASVWCFGVVVRGGVQLCIKKTAGEAIGSEPARSGGKIGFVAAAYRVRLTINDIAIGSPIALRSGRRAPASAKR